jgi:hypothetical protein
VSLHTFQTCLAQLIVDPDYRDRVRGLGSAALEADLTERERARLCRIAADPGVDINRTLHKGFRLGKLRAMLPLTCQLLGSARLAREVGAFWIKRQPGSFYFIPEALEFCNFLAERKLRVKYLDEVLAYERATLEIEKASCAPATAQQVRFRHDPRLLLAALASGRRPRAVPQRPSIAICRQNGAGTIQWQLFEGDLGGTGTTDLPQISPPALAPTY